MLNKIKYLLYGFFLPIWWIQKLIPKQDNVWIFGAWYGQRFSDNSKQLFLYIIECHPEINAIWLTRSRTVKSDMCKLGFTVLMTNSLKAIYYSLIAKYVVVSSSKFDVNYLFNNGSNIVQLWHGNPLKKIGLDDSYSNERSRVKRFLGNFFFPYIYERNYDFVVSNAKIFTPKMASAFGIRMDNVLETGNPRNDIFFDKNEAPFNTLLRAKYPGCRLVYYLPTFRGHNGEQSMLNLPDFDSDLVQKFMETENIVFISKGHFVDNLLFEKHQSTSRIIHLSDQEVDDINLMLKDADLLITDYSGAYFDFLLTEKPIIFAAFDLENYLLQSREMYFKYEDAIAGPCVMNWNELLSSLQTIWTDRMSANLVIEKNKLFNKYHDAYNSKRVYNEIRIRTKSTRKQFI